MRGLLKRYLQEFLDSGPVQEFKTDLASAEEMQAASKRTDFCYMFFRS
jgi:hypothetical protein